MPFRTVVGHRHVVGLLSHAAARNTLPPSFILSGPGGVGKRRVATALAQVLNCLSPVRREESDAGHRQPGPSPRIRKPDSRFRHELPIDACGTCAVCRRIDRGTHPDVIAVGPEGDSAIIGIDQARNISERASYRPYEGRRRVVILDPADAMERPAQNALLKLLEEPPAATMLVLVTSQPDQLLPTVRSRCPQIRFGPLSVSELTEVLTRERKVPEREARAAAALASGSVARALEAASGEVSEARSEALELLRLAAQSRDRRSLMEGMLGTLGLLEKKATKPAVEREHVGLTLRALASLLRDLALMESVAAVADPRGAPSERNESEGASPNVAGDLANADLEGDLAQLSPAFPQQRVMGAYAAVDRALGAIRANTNAKLVVDWLAFQI
jgi:DNA polymerase III subunit delta'